MSKRSCAYIEWKPAFVGKCPDFIPNITTHDSKDADEMFRCRTLFIQMSCEMIMESPLVIAYNNIVDDESQITIDKLSDSEYRKLVFINLIALVFPTFTEAQIKARIAYSDFYIKMKELQEDAKYFYNRIKNLTPDEIDEYDFDYKILA
jgi:hypothetical protein